MELKINVGPTNTSCNIIRTVAYNLLILLILGYSWIECTEFSNEFIFNFFLTINLYNYIHVYNFLMKMICLSCSCI